MLSCAVLRMPWQAGEALEAVRDQGDPRGSTHTAAGSRATCSTLVLCCRAITPAYNMLPCCVTDTQIVGHPHKSLLGGTLPCITHKNTPGAAQHKQHLCSTQAKAASRGPHARFAQRTGTTTASQAQNLSTGHTLPALTHTVITHLRP